MTLFKRGQRNGLSGILSSAGSGILNLLAGIVLIPIILGTVGAGPYGVWLFISALASYLNYSDLGIGSAMVHFASRHRSGHEERDLRTLLRASLLWVSLVLAVVLPVFATVVYIYLDRGSVSHVVGDANRFPLLATGVVMLAGLVLRPFSSALIGWGHLPTERLYQTLGVITRVVGTLVACLIFRDIIVVACVETAAVILPNVLSAFRVRALQEQISTRRSSAWSAMRYMLSYSGRSFGVSAAGALVLQSGVLILGVTSTPQSVAYYNAAFRVYASIRQLITWVTDPMRSALSRINAASAARAEQVVLGIGLLTAWLVLLGCGALALLAPVIIPLWLGSEAPVELLITTVTVLLVGLIANSFHLPLAPAGDAAGKPGVFLVPQIVWLILSISLTFLLAPSLGALGAALGLTLPLLVVEPSYLWLAVSKLGLSIKRWTRSVLLPALLPALTAGTTVALAELVILAGRGGSAGPILLAAIYVVTFISITFATRLRVAWRSVQIALKENL